MAPRKTYALLSDNIADDTQDDDDDDDDDVSNNDGNGISDCNYSCHW